MTESLLIADVQAFLIAHAYGSAKAMPRRHLLHHLHMQGHSIDDRRMRKVYETMEFVGSCSRGIFWIVTAEDRRVAQANLHGRAMATLVRESNIKKSAPCGQMELYEEGR